MVFFCHAGVVVRVSWWWSVTCAFCASGWCVVVCELMDCVCCVARQAGVVVCVKWWWSVHFVCQAGVLWSVSRWTVRCVRQARVLWSVSWWTVHCVHQAGVLWPVRQAGVLWSVCWWTVHCVSGWCVVFCELMNCTWCASGRCVVTCVLMNGMLCASGWCGRRWPTCATAVGLWTRRTCWGTSSCSVSSVSVPNLSPLQCLVG